MYKPHPESEARKRSATSLIKYLLAAKQPEILPTHRRELLGILLFKLTEAEALHKHKTRFQSEGALLCNDKTKLRHDHVFQRAKMIAALETPNEIDNILNAAVACTITDEEHTRLSKCDDIYGWGRYTKAEINVEDTLTDRRIDPTSV